MSQLEPLVAHDFRYAWRAVTVNARFTLLVAITLAVTIGATSTVFSVANAVLLRPLPYAYGDGLVELWSVRGQDPLRQRASFPDFRDWRAQARTLDLAGHGGLETVLTGAGEPERLRAELFVGDLLDLLGVAPQLGAAASGEGAAILSHALWQRRFGGDPGVIGRLVTLDGASYEVAAVMPRGFEFPIRTAGPVDVWLPVERFNPALAERRDARLIEVVGRLRPGTTLAEAQAELDVIAASLSARYPETNRDLRVRVVAALEEATGGVAVGLTLLCAAVAALFLIGCVNVASLQLARTIAREKELATRAALGAARGRIARQLLIESLLLAAFGGVLGALLASWAVATAGAWLAGLLPRAGEIEVDAFVLGSAVALSLAAGSLFGLAPALGAMRAGEGDTLKGSHAGQRRISGRRAFAGLVAVEMALATLLLAGAGLFIHSFVKLDRPDVGFDAGNVLAFELSWPPGKYRDPGDPFARLRTRLLEIPGVVAVSTGVQLPGRGDAVLDDTAPFAEIEGQPAPVGARPRVSTLTIHPGFLRALGIPLVAGRGFSDDDRADTPPVVIVNRSFARAYLNGEAPVGRRLRLDSWRLAGDGRAEIVGLAEDVRHDGLLADVEPLVYLPFAQRPEWDASMIVKTQGDPLAWVPAVREAVRAIDPDLPIDNLSTLEQRLAASLALDRFRALLLFAFSAVAVAIAAVGLFAVLSYATTQRVREIAIRLALGARGGDVARAVVAQGMLPVAAGIFAGALGAAALFKLVDSLLFEVAATDATAFGVAIVALLAVGAAASSVPARRAARIDPALALRE